MTLIQANDRDRACGYIEEDHEHHQTICALERDHDGPHHLVLIS